MAHLPAKFFASDPFKFIVEDTTLYIHSDLVAQVSEPLHRLVHGPMCEAQNQFAVLHGVGAKTFARFCEWAYTGTYSEPKYIGDYAEQNEGAEQNDDPMHLGYKSGGARKSKDITVILRGKNDLNKRYLQSRLERFKAFKRLESSLESVTENAITTLPDSDDTDVLYDALQPHAQLYVFADMYHIQPLKALTLRRLHRMLTKIDLTPESATDVVMLIKYVYENTTKQTSSIRAVLSYYVYYGMEIFVDIPEFRQIMAVNEDILEDFLDIVSVVLKEFNE